MEESEFIRIKLAKISKEDIEFSKHAKDNFSIRGFGVDDITNALKTIDHIIKIKYQPDEKTGKKYKIWVKKSGKYNFVIVINIINDKIRVVTYHLESVKRIKGVRKWLRRR